MWMTIYTKYEEVDKIENGYVGFICYPMIIEKPAFTKIRLILFN